MTAAGTSPEAEIIDEITEPGVYDDLDEAAYHADPVPGGSLSASGAKLLLPPSCPALYRLPARPPEGRPAEFDYGTAAHKFVLGTGPEITVIDALDWRTKAAQDARKDARAKGVIPLLISRVQRDSGDGPRDRAPSRRVRPVRPGAAASRSSRLFWQDDEFGIWRRARLRLAARATRPGSG